MVLLQYENFKNNVNICEAVRVGNLNLKYIKKILFVISLLFVVNSIFAQFVDLGLPSGTNWKSQSEADAYTYAYAVRYYDGFLPTSGQFEELINYCKWTWTGRGY